MVQVAILIIRRGLRPCCILTSIKIVFCRMFVLLSQSQWCLVTHQMKTDKRDRFGKVNTLTLFSTLTWFYKTNLQSAVILWPSVSSAIRYKHTNIQVR